MHLTSTSFGHGGMIPSKFTCDGDNISPELVITDVPLNAEALALIMEDPDVPTNLKPDGMWDHWVLWNLSVTTKIIPEGTQPQSMPGKNTNGGLRYTGPCPPDKEHRYYFKLFALDTPLDLPEGSSKAELVEAMKGHIVAESILMGKYERQQS